MEINSKIFVEKLLAKRFGATRELIMFFSFYMYIPL